MPEPIHSDPQRYQFLKQAFDYATPLTAPEREAYFQSLAAHDPSLAEELRAMFVPVAGGSFLSTPAPIPQEVIDQLRGKNTAKATDAAASIENMGRYKIIRELGKGGMGVVFLAKRSDNTFDKEVAIKVLRGDTVTQRFLDQFRGERQILAKVEHQNIARIMDAGDTPDGLPFYVMEYVDGVPIDQYVAQRNLNLVDRIHLFQQLCRAVHYLHERKIVHRDLKPSNILVDAQGTVRLLDFGIAKQEFSFNPELTSMENRMLTPAYASPEQLQAKPVTAASDVYTLGVILYQLITGQMPDKMPPTVPSSRILETTTRPETTNQLRKRMIGDLDMIVLKAMELDPGNRYRSPQAFLEDLDKFLKGEVVLARPTNLLVRLKKYAVRNKTAVAVAALIVVLAGAGVYFAMDAAAARREAAAQAARINNMSQYIPPLPGGGDDASKILADVQKLTEILKQGNLNAENLSTEALDARNQLLSKSTTYLKQVAAAAEKDPLLAKAVGDAWVGIAEIQAGGGSAKADPNAQLENYLSAKNVLSQASASNPDDPEIVTRLQRIEDKINRLSAQIGKPLPKPLNPPPTPEPSPENPVVGDTKKRNTNSGAAAITPEPVTPSPLPPRPDPVVPRPTDPLLAEAQDRVSQTESKVASTQQLFDTMKADLAARGLSPRPDTVASVIRMNQLLQQAKAQIAGGDGTRAMDTLRAAEAIAARVGKEYGR
jgi:serine/threonine protein kinase